MIVLKKSIFPSVVFCTILAVGLTVSVPVVTNASFGSLGSILSGKSRQKETIKKGTIKVWNNHRYQIIDFGDNYNIAKRYAEKKGAHLAVIETTSESKMLYDFMVAQGYKAAYFGLIDENIDNQWKTSSGVATPLYYWYKGEIKRKKGYEKYAMLHKSAKDGSWLVDTFDSADTKNGTAFIIEWDFVPVTKKPPYIPSNDNTDVGSGGGYYDPHTWDTIDNSDEDIISG